MFRVISACEFVARHGVEQEQGAYALEGGPQGVDVEQIALGDLYAGVEVGLSGIADQDADLGVALDQLLNDLSADTAGGARNEDGHGEISGLGWVDTRKMIDPPGSQ